MIIIIIIGIWLITTLGSFWIIDEYGNPIDTIKEWWKTARENVNFVGAIIWVSAAVILFLPFIIAFYIFLGTAWAIYGFYLGFKYIFRKRD